MTDTAPTSGRAIQIILLKRGCIGFDFFFTVGRAIAEHAQKWWLAPRAGFEPATIRLTVECSTAELPRNRRNLFATGERITKPPSLAKDEIGRSDAASRRDGNYLRRND